MLISNSSRFSYRLMNADDIELLFQLDQDPAVMQYINGGIPSSKEHVKEVLLPRMECYRNVENGWGLWQVNVTQTQQYIGWILVRPMFFFADNTEFDNIELGWRFFRSAWGKGFASEAALQVMHHLSTNKSIKKFSAIADQNNIASISIMKKIGMQYKTRYKHIDPLFEAEVEYYQRQNSIQ